MCKINQILIKELKPSDSGQLINLLLELEYSHTICENTVLYATREFQDIIRNEILSFLNEDLSNDIMVT